jgi:hypothetical protein
MVKLWDAFLLDLYHVLCYAFFVISTGVSNFKRWESKSIYCGASDVHQKIKLWSMTGYYNSTELIIAGDHR